MERAANTRDYDVVILGGALAGAGTAIQLLRDNPGLRILIIEKNAVFSRRVGEATVEVSGFFLSRILGLMDHLNDAHLVKQGMRFWFADGQTETLEDCSEIGGRYLARIPAFQVDRAVLDEEVLRRASGMGAEVWRPAAVGKVALSPGGQQTIEVRRAGHEPETVRARWVVDASGVAALLARQQGWFRSNAAHPISALWARWTGVKNWDGMEFARKYPEWSKACHGIRYTATNHLVGDGWWAWCIPLKGGDVSIGVVFDERLTSIPEGASLGQRLKDFLMRHPAGREILQDAHWKEGDVHWRKHLPYYSTTYAGNGFVLVGDAAGFLDPFYSPGMDWVSFSTSSAARLILAERGGAEVEPLAAEYNRSFGQSYHNWFEALYLNKYEYMGDYDLMRLAFLLDLGLYYLGVVSQPFKLGAGAFQNPLFSTPRSIPAFRLMRLYNRRFAHMARVRRRRERWGRNNHRRRFLFPGYTLATASGIHIIKALAGWLWLECTEGWRTPGPARTDAPAVRRNSKPAAEPVSAQELGG